MDGVLLICVNTLVLIVAAGKSTRFGENKIHKKLPSGKSLLQKSLAVFSTHNQLASAAKSTKVVVAIPPDNQKPYLEAMAEFEARFGVLPVGGKTRAETVANSLKAVDKLEAKGFDSILIHDAARGLVSHRVIDNVLAALKQGAKAVVPAVAVADTLKRCVNPSAGKLAGNSVSNPPSAGNQLTVSETLPREGLFAAQTPQGFNLKALRSAIAPPFDYTDEAQLMERTGITPVVVEGDASNIKVTTPQDWQLAERLERGLESGLEGGLEAGGIRIGCGFDSHRLGVGETLVLGGLKLEGVMVKGKRLGLVGHSDADVVLHALTDALLGAMGLGDIGTHFAPSEARWKNAPSPQFVEFAMTQLQKRKARLVNTDLTVICEEPKIQPLRAAMVQRIAQILGTEQEQVSIKGTTTEGLGFEGRGEGISAMAVVAVAMPLVNGKGQGVKAVGRTKVIVGKGRADG